MSYPDYIAPLNLEDALIILADTTRNSRLIAGGTYLIPLMHSGEIKPDLLVDIKRLPISQIYLQGNTLHLGAGVTCSQTSEDPLVRSNFTTLSEACSELGNPSIRSRCTLGGNLAASIPESNIVPALLVYDAQLVIANSSGERATSLVDFFGENGRAILEPGELVKEILIALPPPITASHIIKIGKRRGMVTAIAIVAVRLSMNQEHALSEARIALGAYTHKPLRLEIAENSLVGRSLDDAPFEILSRLAVEPYPARHDQLASADYRKRIAMVLIDRALQTVRSELRRLDLDG